MCSRTQLISQARWEPCPVSQAGHIPERAAPSCSCPSCCARVGRGAQTVSCPWCGCHAAVCHDSNQISCSREQFSSPWESGRRLCWPCTWLPARGAVPSGALRPWLGTLGWALPQARRHCWATPEWPQGHGSQGGSCLLPLVHPVSGTCHAMPCHPSHPIPSPVLPSASHPLPSVSFLAMPCHLIPSLPFSFILSHPIESDSPFYPIPFYPFLCPVSFHAMPSMAFVLALTMSCHPIPSVLLCPILPPLIPSQPAPFSVSSPMILSHSITSWPYHACPLQSHPPSSNSSVLSASPSDQSCAILWVSPVPFSDLFLFHPKPIPVGCTSHCASHARGRSGRAEPGHHPLAVTAHTHSHVGN